MFGAAIAADAGWKPFPSTAPISGLPILVGGLTLEGRWIDLVVHFDRFEAEPHHICRKSQNMESQWIVSGFITLSNFPDVKWLWWHFGPSPPPLPA